MIDTKAIRVRNYARRRMLFSKAFHASYGLMYVDNYDQLVESIASEPSQIQYFYSDQEYNNYIKQVKEQYPNAVVLAVHNNDYM